MFRGRPSAPRLLVGALVVFCIAVWSLVLAPEEAEVKTLSAAVEQVLLPQENTQNRLDALLATQADTALGARTKTSGCQVNGAYPDPACTPGSVFVGVATSTICKSGYTKTVRSVSTKLRQQIYRAYDVAYPPPRGSYELDHFVPLALGGDNSAANLFPEAANPKPGFREKDVVEVYLYERVCAGAVGLAAAQKLIAEDWLAVYNALEKSEIARIKQKYTSWAN